MPLPLERECNRVLGQPLRPASRDVGLLAAHARRHACDGERRAPGVGGLGRKHNLLPNSCWVTAFGLTTLPAMSRDQAATSARNPSTEVCSRLAALVSSWVEPSTSSA